uniref:AMDV2_8 n=1 Tax=uncultured virus TaxID=340016 RepID=B3GAK7_9VIRU|nr:AMDV2_8 [uncultured virus]
MNKSTIIFLFFLTIFSGFIVLTIFDKLPKFSNPLNSVQTSFVYSVFNIFIPLIIMVIVLYIIVRIVQK